MLLNAIIFNNLLYSSVKLMKYRSSMIEVLDWSIKIDLHSDFQSIMFDRLLNMGFTPTSQENSPLLFFKAAWHYVTRRKRQVFYSKEFTCPDAYKPALFKFQQLVEHGNDITPYMTKKRKDLGFNDLLFNDWHIHHFHLSDHIFPDESAKRSDYLLFAYFTDTSAYFLQVYSHRMSFAFSCQELIRILHRNWPELISNRRLEGISSIRMCSDEEYSRKRKAHALTLVQADHDTVYFPLGGGYASDCSSIAAVETADYWKAKLGEIQADFIANARSIVKKLIEEGMSPHLVFEFVFASDECLFLIEKSNGFAVKYNPFEMSIRLCDPLELFTPEQSRLRYPSTFI